MNSKTISDEEIYIKFSGFIMHSKKPKPNAIAGINEHVAGYINVLHIVDFEY